MLPLRGDTKSRLVTALALAYRSSFWILIVWAPVGAIVAIAYFAHSEKLDLPEVVGLSAAVLFGIAMGAALSLILSRGVMAGNRLAYLLVGLLIFVSGLFHALLPLLTPTAPVIVLGVSRFLAYTAVGTVIFIIGVRSAHQHG